MIYPKKLNPFRVTKSTAIFGSVFTFLVMYNLADNLAPRGVFYWREIYAVVYLGILITSLISFFLCRNSKALPPQYFLVTLFIMVVGLFALLPGIEWPLKYIVGDLAIISMLFIYGTIAKPLFSTFNGKNLILLSGMFVFLSLVSYLVMSFGLNQQYLHGNRFDPPHIFAIAGLSALILSSKGLSFFFVTSLFILTGILVLACQWRANILFFIVGAIPIGVVLMRRNIFLFWIIFFSIIIFLSIYIEPIRENIYSIAAGSRFAELASSGEDTSFFNRLLEVKDVWLAMSTENNVLRWLFGFGHGAMYPTVFSYPEPNVFSGGRVHNIHIHIFLWLFRYGFFGVGVYLFFVIKVLIEYYFFLIHTEKYQVIDGFFIISAMMLVIKSFFYTPINDPVNLLLIVGFFYMSWKRKTMNWN